MTQTAVAHGLTTRSQRYRRAMESLMIRAKNGRIIPMRFRPSQEIMWKQIAPRLDAGDKLWFIFLKARQTYCSTFIQALTFVRTLEQSGTNSLVIAQDLDTSHDLFGKSKMFYDYLPLPKIGPSRIKELEFPFPGGVSRYRVISAGIAAKGRGTTQSCVHACLTGDVLIEMEDGDLVPIADVDCGDRVRTHSGTWATVTAISRRPATDVSERGRARAIRVWGTSLPLTVTPDHRLWTSRGWVAAKDLTTADEIGASIQPLTGTKHTLTIQCESFERVQGGGSRPTQGEMALTRETGFFFGYYLAEGSLVKQHTSRRTPSAITLTGHRDEIRYSERAVEAVRPWISSVRVTERSPAKTLETICYSTALATTIQRECGETDSKRLPTWILDAPREFVIGVLDGYISGDGSKRLACDQGYSDPRISITSTRVRLLVGLRHVLASLGWGWAGLRQRHAETFVDARGWINRPAWVLDINGQAALRVRDAIGWVMPTDTGWTGARRRWTQKYRLDATMVWAKVRTITDVAADDVYDLAVDHPDHSFTTAAGAVANSEVAFWPHPEIMTGLMQAMPDLPDTIWIIESTANGLMGQGRLFYDEWNRAVRGESDLIPVFIPWFTIPEYRRSPGVPMDDWTPKERLMVDTYGLTGEQLAWRRATILTKTQGSETFFDQEYPDSPEVAFISKGNPAFDELQLLAMRKEQRAPHVRWTLNGDTLEESEGGEVRVWEDPKPGCQYAIGADTAEGRTGGDYAAAEVIEMNSLTQVASIHGTIQPYDFAMLLNAVGRHYNNAIVCIEVYPQGHAVQDVLIRHTMYPNLHRWRGKPDRVKMIPMRLYGYETNVWSRPLLIEAGQRAINRGLVTLYEEGLIDELKHFTKTDDGRYEAEAGHDDRVIALLLALRSREENYIARGVPPQLSVPDAVGIRVVEGRDVKADAQRRVSRLLRDAKSAVKGWMQY